MFVIECELAVIAGLLAYPLLRRRVTVIEHRAAEVVHDAAADTVKLMRWTAAHHWELIGHRHLSHPDVREALKTPGLAVMHSDGRIEAGR